MKLVVGATYQKTLEWPRGTIVVFTVLAEVMARPVCPRPGKLREPGWCFLILEIDGPVYTDLAVGQIHDFVDGALFFTKLKRLA